MHLAHTVLTRPLYSVSLSGFVETRDIRERTDRFVLRVTQMDAPRFSGKLDRVRLSVRKGTAPDVGSFVELKARLQPPLAPLRPGSYDFSRDLFFQGTLADGVSCDDAGCVVEAAGGGGFIAQALRGDAPDDCERAVPVVTARQPPVDCGASVIDLARLRRQGALALWRKRDGFVVEAAKPNGFDRPWSPAAAGEIENDSTIISRPSPPRARDATPSETDVQADE